MAAEEPLERDLQEMLQGLRSSINYSIDHASRLCDEIGRRLAVTEEDLDATQTEISELIRSIDRVRKACVRCRRELLDPGVGDVQSGQRKSLEQLERLMGLKGQFEERENTLRNRKDKLQEQRHRVREELQEAENALSRLRFAREMLCAENGDVKSPEGDGRELSLAAVTVEFAERERLRLARELHDGPAQLFSAAILLMELVEKVLSMGDTERAVMEVTRVRDQMKDSLADIRSFLWHLNPQVLESGLRRGLEKLVEQVQERSRPALQFQFRGSDAKIDAVHAANVFRMVQEAVNNAVKNGNAGEVRIRISVREGEIHGVIEDDGCGFDVESAKRRSREKGSFGLSNMEERARLIGGKLTLDSFPGKGTRVSFRVPIGGGGPFEGNQSRTGR